MNPESTSELDRVSPSTVSPLDKALRRTGISAGRLPWRSDRGIEIGRQAALSN
jgi:hypothetical protein